MSTCEHADELRPLWEGFDHGPNFCGTVDPHAPHGVCLGIMCDYGCNTEDF